MSEHFALIKNIHILAISLSGFLFFLRAAFSIYGAKWPRNFAIRLIVYIIDIALLTAALLLWAILPKETFENGWLHFKLILVFLYILSGFGAMSVKLNRPKRIGFYILAALLFITIIGIARAHNIMGWFL